MRTVNTRTSRNLTGAPAHSGIGSCIGADAGGGTKAVTEGNAGAGSKSSGFEATALAGADALVAPCPASAPPSRRLAACAQAEPSSAVAIAKVRTATLHHARQSPPATRGRSDHWRPTKR